MLYCYLVLFQTIWSSSLASKFLCLFKQQGGYVHVASGDHQTHFQSHHRQSYFETFNLPLDFAVDTKQLDSAYRKLQKKYELCLPIFALVLLDINRLSPRWHPDLFYNKSQVGLTHVSEIIKSRRTYSVNHPLE